MFENRLGTALVHLVRQRRRRPLVLGLLGFDFFCVFAAVPPFFVFLLLFSFSRARTRKNRWAPTLCGIHSGVLAAAVALSGLVWSIQNTGHVISRRRADSNLSHREIFFSPSRGRRVERNNNTRETPNDIQKADTTQQRRRSPNAAQNRLSAAPPARCQQLEGGGPTARGGQSARAACPAPTVRRQPLREKPFSPQPWTTGSSDTKRIDAIFNTTPRKTPLSVVFRG